MATTDRTLTDLFAATVMRFGERPAVTDHEQTLTYAELDRRSTALALRLRECGVTVESRVGLYLDRSVDVFVAILGALKAGGAYIAVDIRYPHSRRDLMLTNSGADVVITRPEWRERVEHLPTRLRLYRDEASPSATPPLPGGPRPGDAASILFTSGSSGSPKGIVLEHRNIVSFATNPSLPTLRSDDRTGQVSNLSFDAFHYEMWSTFASGAEVVVLPPVPDLLAADFEREMRRRRITVMLVPTMVLNHVVREDRNAFAPLRVLLVGGDVVRPSACRDVLAGQFAGALYNLYGPAEISTACTIQRVTEVEAALDAIPIGKAFSGVTVHLLTSTMDRVPSGQVGEIYVGGPGLARGYMDAPDLTNARFLTDPFGGPADRLYRTGDLARERPDGSLEFIGRVDDQVKVRGFRVEPGEVEKGLRRHPEVHEAAVLAAGEGNDRHLVAFVVLESALTLRDLRTYAAADLPDFMVPSQFIAVAEIPATDHGKRDTDALRSMLAEHSRRQAMRRAPATVTEQYLADLWSELLNVEGVGANDDFFELGGHSLLALRVKLRIERELAVKLDYQLILANPSLTRLATVVDTTQTEDAACEGRA